MRQLGRACSLGVALLACIRQTEGTFIGDSVESATASDHLYLLQRAARRADEGGIWGFGETGSESKEKQGGYFLPDTPLLCKTKIVVDAGLPRTSTVSFSLWAHELGYVTVHHSPQMRLRTDNYEHFYDLLPNKPVAFSDAPWSLEACLIAARRPSTMAKADVKFLSFKRNASAWYESLKHMTCAYGGAHFTSDSCRKSGSKEQGQLLAKAPGEWQDVAKNYRPAFIDLADWLKSRWCQRFDEDVDRFCSTEEKLDSPEVQLEIATTAQFMENFRQQLRTCVDPESLLELDVEDPSKVEKMADFLGCSGDIPHYPLASDTNHVLLELEHVESK